MNDIRRAQVQGLSMLVIGSLASIGIGYSYQLRNQQYLDAAPHETRTVGDTTFSHATANGVLGQQFDRYVVRTPRRTTQCELTENKQYLSYSSKPDLPKAEIKALCKRAREQF